MLLLRQQHGTVGCIVAINYSIKVQKRFIEDVFGSSLKDQLFYEGVIDYFYQSERFEKLSF